jgi:excisionase family DNA binding protein
MKLALTVKEAAEALSVSESTVYWMIYRGEIAHNRVKAKGCRGKGKILISKAALEKWLLGGMPENKKAAEAANHR